MQPPSSADVAFQLNSVAIHLVRRARTTDQELGVPPGQLSALSVLVFGGERTIADLAGVDAVGRIHVAEALSYRRQAPRN